MLNSLISKSLKTERSLSSADGNNCIYGSLSVNPRLGLSTALPTEKTKRFKKKVNNYKSKLPATSGNKYYYISRHKVITPAYVPVAGCDGGCSHKVMTPAYSPLPRANSVLSPQASPCSPLYNPIATSNLFDSIANSPKYMATSPNYSSTLSLSPSHSPNFATPPRSVANASSPRHYSPCYSPNYEHAHFCHEGESDKHKSCYHPSYSSHALRSPTSPQYTPCISYDDNSGMNQGATAKSTVGHHRKDNGMYEYYKYLSSKGKKLTTNDKFTMSTFVVSDQDDEKGKGGIINRDGDCLSRN